MADLGAMVITGLGGNPLSVLRTQTGLKMAKIKRRCPLYFTTGLATAARYRASVSKLFTFVFQERW